MTNGRGGRRIQLCANLKTRYFRSRSLAAQRYFATRSTNFFTRALSRYA